MPELFFNNKPLDEDRTIGYHNIQEGSIIETCSNPLWVSICYAILGDFEVFRFLYLSFYDLFLVEKNKYMNTQVALGKADI